MNPKTPPPSVVDPEQLRHAQNEALLQRDFDSEAALADQTRWWHNRAIHNTYGIVEGLETFPVDDALVVTPGLAYDSFGRELMLDAPWQGVVPEADEPLVVVIARADVSPRGCSPPADGYCRDMRTADPTVIVRWQPLAGFTPHDGVLLATVPPKKPPHEHDRIYARALAAAHRARRDRSRWSAWAPWTEVRDGLEWFLGLELQVDTSAAGFTAVPCYFAQLTGSMWDPRVSRLFLIPFQHIVAPDKDHFTYRLLAPWLFTAARFARSAAPVPNFASAFRGYTNLTGLAVTWRGIQQHIAPRAARVRPESEVTVQFIDATRSIERQRFFDGQRLFASDMQTTEAFNREMRWLHNQSLHQPGVGNGFAVSGKKGDREVRVGAGYAIDDLGREIVLTSSRTIPVLPVADSGFGNPQRFLLTVQYPEDDDLEEVERRQGMCGTDGAVRLREEPIFCWVKLNATGTPSVDQDRIVSGRQLVLAEVAVRECKLADDISIVQRRNARPPVQPYIACGSAHATLWKAWDEWADLLEASAGERFSVQTYEAFGIVGGVQAEIDTTSAGFHAPPDYFARIDGPRLVTVSYGDNQDASFVVDGLLSIVEPTASGFVAQVVVLAFPAASRHVVTFRSNRRTNAYTMFGGFDISALGADPAEFSETSEISAPAATADTTVADVLRDWTVGWMGVEG